MGMDKAASIAQPPDEAEQDGAEQRAGPHFTLLIRAAKLVSAQGEFVCVIRDVSESGVSLRLFHALPSCQQYELHTPAGAVYLVDGCGAATTRPASPLRKRSMWGG